MINSEVFIIKRDGKKETFSLDKIKNAIAKAFLSVGSFATQDVITTVLSRVSVSDGMNVEEIQNQVEVALMAEHYYSVAKAYMLYRQKHLEDREVRDKLKFLLDYCDASNPATGSKYDANANVENKNIATLIGELPKSNFIRLNRRLLTDRLKDMYGKELSDRYLELLKRVCRNARCTFFLFIIIQTCSFSLSCDLLKISLIYVFPVSKNSSYKLIKQSNQPVHTFFCQFCTHLFYIEGNG